MKIQNTPQTANFSVNSNIDTEPKNDKWLNKYNNLMEQLSKPPVPNTDTAIGVISKNLPISEQAKNLYSHFKANARAEVDQNLDERERSIETYRKTMVDIMEEPIEVKILPSEINEALLFNNLGINYLEYKELKVRLEMLALAEQDIDKDTTLNRSDKEKLRDITADLRAQLQLQIDELLAGKEKPDEENQRLDFSNRINTQFEDLGLNDVDKFDLLKRMV